MQSPVMPAFPLGLIEDASRAFKPSELAYLALTSKIERPFMDRFAFAAQAALQGDGSLVAREFAVPGAGRADVAILKNNQVRCIVEGKAMTAADCTRAEPRRREYADHLQRDLARYASAPLPAADIYCVLLGIHPLALLPSELRPVVKYHGLLNGAFRRLQTPDRIRAEADTSLRGYLRVDAVIGSGAFEGGVAFGIPVEVLWWCFGPFRTPAGLSILRGHAP